MCKNLASMNRNKLCILLGIACLSLIVVCSPFNRSRDNRILVSRVPEIKLATKKTTPTQPLDAEKAAEPAEIETPVTHTKPHQGPLKHINLKNMALKEVPFEQLPGWEKTDVKKSLLAFQTSCKTFMNQDPKQPVGSSTLKLQARDWQPACKEALAAKSFTEGRAKQFFETWFHPMEFVKKASPRRGVFTGYYMPKLKGSLVKTKQYHIPIYGMPRNAKNARHYTRAAIDHGALDKKAPVIAWIDSPVERLFMEVEGAGVIELTNGEKLYIGYAGQNGAPYTSIASVLIRRGVMTKHNASKPAIKRYLERNPQVADSILHQNKSFVFFETLNQNSALGARGTELTPGYSLAVDKKWIPLGAPLWLATTKPEQQANDKRFQRLMIAQDTGGAIQGVVRGDVYWGSSEKAAYLGEHMKNKGRYWLLLPKRAYERLAV